MFRPRTNHRKWPDRRICNLSNSSFSVFLTLRLHTSYRWNWAWSWAVTWAISFFPRNSLLSTVQGVGLSIWYLIRDTCGLRIIWKNEVLQSFGKSRDGIDGFGGRSFQHRPQLKIGQQQHPLSNHTDLWQTYPPPLVSDRAGGGKVDELSE